MSVQARSEALIEAVRSVGMFDPDYYRSSSGAPSSSTDEELLLQSLSDVEGRQDPSPLFSQRDYLALNPDVAAARISGLAHYALYGFHEGRHAFSERKCREFLRQAQHNPLTPIGAILPKSKPIRVLSAKSGNFFFTDIAAYIGHALAEMGWTTAVMSDADPREDEAGWFDLVVAPHEYMVIGKGQFWSSGRSERAAYFNTEQWQTTWFSKCFKHLKTSKRGVLDLNPTSAAALASLGIPAAFLPLFPLEGTPFEQRAATISRGLVRRKHVTALTYPDAILDRPYDVLFVATLNTRRDEQLAQLAPTLARFHSFVHCPHLLSPVRPGSGDMISGRDFTQLAMNSKILLNIHRDEIGYFEWHRLVLYGIMNGTVVLSEPNFPVPAVQAGVHYLEADGEHLPQTLASLLTTAEGRARLQEISRNCQMLAREVAAGRWWPQA